MLIALLPQRHAVSTASAVGSHHAGLRTLDGMVHADAGMESGMQSGMQSAQALREQEQEEVASDAHSRNYAIEATILPGSELLGEHPIALERLVGSELPAASAADLKPRDPGLIDLIPGPRDRIPGPHVTGYRVHT